VLAAWSGRLVPSNRWRVAGLADGRDVPEAAELHELVRDTGAAAPGGDHRIGPSSALVERQPSPHVVVPHVSAVEPPEVDRSGRASGVRLPEHAEGRPTT
jgi:hypothetical protein